MYSKFVNQIITYFRMSFNELDIQKQHISQWFVVVLENVLFWAEKVMKVN